MISTPEPVQLQNPLYQEESLHQGCSSSLMTLPGVKRYKLTQLRQTVLNWMYWE